MGFRTAVAGLADLGVWNILLPFMLVFTIVYATLTTTLKSMFGKTEERDNSKFAVVIALVVGLGVVIPHAIGAYPPGADVVEIMNRSLPQVALISVAILGLMILLGMFGIDTKTFGTKNIMSFIIFASIGFIVYIFGSAADIWSGPPQWLGFLNDPDTVMLVVVILVFGLIVKFITSDGGGNSSSWDQTLKKFNNAFFGGEKKGEEKKEG